MFFPAGIDSYWFSSTEFPAKEFEEAKALHLKEEYGDSNDILKDLFRTNLSIAGKESVCAYQALVLFGWNLVFQKDVSGLNKAI